MKKTENIIIDCIQDYFNDELDDTPFDRNNLDAKLFGAGGPLDSMDLVVLLVQIEERIEEELGVEIVIASEKAMSRRTSPFVRVKYLIEFINKLINDKK
jgi:acyl carrier protein